MLASAHNWLDRYPTVADAALATALLGFSLAAIPGTSGDDRAAAIVLTALLIAPLPFRRRAPVATFAAVILACGAELFFLDEFIAANAAALIALYTLVAYAPRPFGAIGFATALAGTVPFALRFDDPSSSDALLTWAVLVVHLLLASALGDRMRARIREREGLKQRAHTLAAERDQRAAAATTAERTRIVGELHDIVAHSLSVVIAQADGGRYAAERDPAAAADALETISTTARQAQAEMRRALHALSEEPGAPRRPQPRMGDLATLVERTREAGLAVELTEQGRPGPLTPAAAMTVYRVAQEALTNVLKHAGPGASAAVTLSWEPGWVRIAVRDDGTGDAAPDDGIGRGLAGMRERVEPRGGSFYAGPRPEGGFEVRAEVPTEVTPTQLTPTQLTPTQLTPTQLTPSELTP